MVVHWLAFFPCPKQVHSFPLSLCCAALLQAGRKSTSSASSIYVLFSLPESSWSDQIRSDLIWAEQSEWAFERPPRPVSRPDWQLEEVMQKEYRAAKKERERKAFNSCPPWCESSQRKDCTLISLQKRENAASCFLPRNAYCLFPDSSTYCIMNEEKDDFSFHGMV